jgi:hypothetical protein
MTITINLPVEKLATPITAAKREVKKIHNTFWATKMELQLRRGDLAGAIYSSKKIQF